MDSTTTTRRKQRPRKDDHNGNGEINLPAILSKLESVKKTPAGYTARCPAHDDQRSSLSLAIGEDGRTLLHCHAGCSTEAIVGKLGLTMRHLMPIGNGTAHRNSKREIIATYDYRDEQGGLLFQVVRYNPKDFRQRASKPGGGWAWTVEHIRKVPYRLPELLAVDPAVVVYIAEGEKDVDRLVKFGLVATTNTGGAGKWKSAFADFLVGRKVAILPDNDKAGRDHGEQVAQSLHGKATSVKVIELPGLPEKGDISDWLDSGGTAEELLRIVQAAPDWQPSPTSDEKPSRNTDDQPNERKHKPKTRQGGQLSNAIIVTEGEGEEKKTIILPRPMREIVGLASQRTGGELRRVDGALFAHAAGERLDWFDSAPRFSATSRRAAGSSIGNAARDLPRKTNSFASCSGKRRRLWPWKSYRTGRQSRAITTLVRCQSRATAVALSELIDMHCLETDRDRELAFALWATAVWGGPPGTRPAFLVTATAGRGKGKSRFSQELRADLRGSTRHQPPGGTSARSNSGYYLREQQRSAPPVWTTSRPYAFRGRSLRPSLPPTRSTGNGCTRGTRAGPMSLPGLSRSMGPASVPIWPSGLSRFAYASRPIPRRGRKRLPLSSRRTGRRSLPTASDSYSGPPSR